MHLDNFRAFLHTLTYSSLGRGGMTHSVSELRRRSWAGTAQPLFPPSPWKSAASGRESSPLNCSAIVYQGEVPQFSSTVQE